MNKKYQVYASLLIIVALLAFMIYDFIRPEAATEETVSAAVEIIPDSWKVTDELPVREGKLSAVAVSQSGVYVGGDSFISCYSSDLSNAVWSIKTDAPVTSLAVNGDSLFASTTDQIIILSNKGLVLGEWGPYEKDCMITSVSVNRECVAFADAGNRTVFILDKGGEVKKMIGHNDTQFIVPSPYFDVALNEDNSFIVANTGHRRIETWDPEGSLVSLFGEPGLAPGAFCGCCNPAHFAVVPEGFITAEKGLNRIKILNTKGEFVEFVSGDNDFEPSIPLDIASIDGKTIYAANPANSKLYVFERK
jgi:hypothetical protein